MKKQRSQAFKKEIYLLGSDAEGVKYWLETPSWDCGWYWGFGYVETYTNNTDPSKARDVESHQHADGEYKSQCVNPTSDTNIFTGDFLIQKTFKDTEGWKLRELMATFYHLKEQATFFDHGGMHITTNPLARQFAKPERAKNINEKDIPAVTAEILAILSPEA